MIHHHWLAGCVDESAAAKEAFKLRRIRSLTQAVFLAGVDVVLANQNRKALVHDGVTADITIKASLHDSALYLVSTFLCGCTTYALDNLQGVFLRVIQIV